MSRRANAQFRCARCHLHASLCLCAQLPRVSVRTRLVLVTHRFEDRKPTNTGRLAAECLTNSEVWVRGNSGSSDEAFALDPQTQPLLLFPSEDAIPIMQFVASQRPIALVVPDGTWRQASKVKKRVPCLARVPRVSLPRVGAETQYRLRHEVREGGLATIEAIARAFGVLEGQAVQTALERVFRIMVERTLWCRGVLDAGSVTGGIPSGALRHAPASVIRV